MSTFHMNKGRRRLLLYCAGCAMLFFLWLGTGSAWGEGAAPAEPFLLQGGSSTAGEDADLPPSVTPKVPAFGIQFGVGQMQNTVEIATQGLPLEPHPGFSNGAAMTLDFVLGNFRVGYAREMYRGITAPAVNYDADQLWLFYGFRPWSLLYLGFGIGTQHRKISIPSPEGTDTFLEDTPLRGAVVDLFFGPPFSLRLLLRQENTLGTSRVNGRVLTFSYIVPFSGE